MLTDLKRKLVKVNLKAEKCLTRAKAQKLLRKAKKINRKVTEII